MVVPMKYSRVEARSHPCTGATYISIHPSRSQRCATSQLAVCYERPSPLRPSPSLPLPHTLQAYAAERGGVAVPGRCERGGWVGYFELMSVSGRCGRRRWVGGWYCVAPESAREVGTGAEAHSSADFCTSPQFPRTFRGGGKVGSDIHYLEAGAARGEEGRAEGRMRRCPPAAGMVDGEFFTLTS